MNTNKIFSLICAAILLVAGTSFAQKNKNDKPLDGFNYDVKITVEAQAKPTKPLEDDLSFKGSKLKSKALAEKYNFKSGEFTATVDSSNAEEVVITFDAVMKGETADDVLTWHGTVTGEDIEGSAIWTKKGKTKKSFAFVGIQKKKK
jgi:uncharacterized protein YxeA